MSIFLLGGGRTPSPHPSSFGRLHVKPLVAPQVVGWGCSQPKRALCCPRLHPTFAAPVVQQCLALALRVPCGGAIGVLSAFFLRGCFFLDWSENLSFEFWRGLPTFSGVNNGIGRKPWPKERAATAVFHSYHWRLCAVSVSLPVLCIFMLLHWPRSKTEIVG